MTNLEAFGWDAHWQRAFAPFEKDGVLPGRLVVEFRGQFRVRMETEERVVQVPKRMHHSAQGRGELPAVGDWVAVEIPKSGRDTGLIRGVLSRKSKFSRKAAGDSTLEQVVAANMDEVWMVSALGNDFNPRRMERYITLGWESGAQPVLIFTKTDQIEDPEPFYRELEFVGHNVPKFFVSNVTGQGVEELKGTLSPGKTIALIGSSGVGKSSLINCLAGTELMKVGGTRLSDGKGHHTTTYRHLHQLPCGGLLLDTPGMRELRLWNADIGLHESFPEIESLALSCRFNDCQHRNEPGCAVRQALEEGTLKEGRLEAFHKLMEELLVLKQLQKRHQQMQNRKRPPRDEAFYWD